MELLSAMITPAVLISACGTLILSTSNRLGRIVDRVRQLSDHLESLAGGNVRDHVPERRVEVERQLASHAERGRLIQQSLTSFYVALGTFVATTMCLGLAALLEAFPRWLPGALGILGTLVLLYGCVLLIRETRLALRSVNSEMEFVLRMSESFRERPGHGSDQDDAA